jgi:hypothetical protein
MRFDGGAWRIVPTQCGDRGWEDCVSPGLAGRGCCGLSCSPGDGTGVGQ